MNLDNLEAEYYTLDRFRFENKTVLENLSVEYTTVGTPQYDDEGHICNAILYFHGTTGNYGSIKRISDQMGDGMPFDTGKYFFISLSTLGTPQSASASTTGLEFEFPEYSIVDMVNFNKQFIEECFGITHLRGVIGNSMGGFEAITWACEYPESIDFLISLVSSYKVAGQNYLLSRTMYDIIRSDPDFGKKTRSESLKRSLEMSGRAMFSFGLSREFYTDQKTENLAEDMDSFAKEDAQEDVYDEFYRCAASMNYDLSDKLKNIKAKTMIIAIYEDQYFPPQLDAIPMHALIKNSTLACYNSYLGHVGSSQLEKIHEQLEDFMLQV